MTPRLTNPRDLPPQEDDAFDLADTLAETEPCDETVDAPQTPESVKRGVDVIKKHWRHAPNGPGVYRMIAESG
jgi:excinuclease ABC subunit C